MARNFRRLQVWQRAHELAKEVYVQTRRFPKEELFGLVSQMRRAAASIPSNIAEGCGRRMQGDLVRFLDIAHGSTSELDYQLTLAHELGYLPQEDAERMSEEAEAVSRMLDAYACRVRGENANKVTIHKLKAHSS